MAKLQLGDRWVTFTLRGVDNKLRSLVDYGDRVGVAVVFMCNHCPFVKAWEDRLIRIQADYGNLGVQIVAVNSDDAVRHPEDTFDKMVARARQKGYNFPYLHDEKQEVARAYGATHMPEIFLFDQLHTLCFRGVVDDNHQNPGAVQRAYLRQAITALLGGYHPPIEETDLVGTPISWK